MGIGRREEVEAGVKKETEVNEICNGKRHRNKVDEEELRNAKGDRIGS
jgi:hypothetical protein